MIYPEKIKSKKINVFLKIFTYTIIAISIILFIINKLTTPNIYWSFLCIIGLVYINLTVRYSITKMRNIAGYVMIQTILLAVLMVFIDYRIGYSGWSISISLPILIIISNFTMFIITIINYKHYEKYATSQLIIVLISLVMIYLVYKGYTTANALINISVMISIFNFLISLVLCHRDFKEEIIKKFNI